MRIATNDVEFTAEQVGEVFAAERRRLLRHHGFEAGSYPVEDEQVSRLVAKVNAEARSETKRLVGEQAWTNYRQASGDANAYNNRKFRGSGLDERTGAAARRRARARRASERRSSSY